MKLRFGDLEDIISIEKVEIQVLQEELNKLLKEECDNVENCDMRLAGILCESCSVKEECRKESQKIFDKADILEEEMKKRLKKIKYLLMELFLSQNEGTQLKYLGLELFPKG